MQKYRNVLSERKKSMFSDKNLPHMNNGPLSFNCPNLRDTADLDDLCCQKKTLSDK